MPTFPIITRHAFVRALAGALCTMLPLAAFASDPLPTGQVQAGQSTIEPGYNDADGSLLYIKTPI